MGGLMGSAVALFAGYVKVEDIRGLATFGVEALVVELTIFVLILSCGLCCAQIRAETPEAAYASLEDVVVIVEED